MRPHPLTVAVFVAGLAGFAFAAFSSYDFTAHLDRQVHGVHCSFLPGIVGADASESSGCEVTLMSPYSSVFRTSIWGGVPIALPAMSVFLFLVFWTVSIVLFRMQEDSGATLFLMLATCLPLLASLVMGIISISELDTTCKLCVGIYASSVLAFVAAVGLWLRARRSDSLRAVSSADDRDDAPTTRLSMLGGLGLFVLGVLFVSFPVMAYAMRAPAFDRYIGSCGELSAPADPSGVLVPVGGNARGGGLGIDVVEVLDPLCPACRGFERRFQALSEAQQLHRRALLFPLDSECNWMVDRPIHPGACAVSEAILCAGNDASRVLAWSFEHQDRIREAAANNPNAPAQMVSAEFPQLKDCIGSPRIRSKLNLGLRWAVHNQMPVLTPQVYVAGMRMCDADTDLGMDYALTRLVERAKTRPRMPREETPAGGVAPRGPSAPGAVPPREPARPSTPTPANTESNSGANAPRGQGETVPAAEDTAAGEPTGDSPADSNANLPGSATGDAPADETTPSGGSPSPGEPPSAPPSGGAAAPSPTPPPTDTPSPPGGSATGGAAEEAQP